MTILSIIQNVCPTIGLPRPSSVVGNTSAQVQTLLGLAQIGGEELAEAHPWNILTRRVIFNGVAANAQTNQPPTDYNRFPAGQRLWSVSRRTWLLGPQSTDQWDNIIIQPQIAYPGYWCLLQGLINIAPAPATTDQFRYSYISENWVRPQGAPTDFSGDRSSWTNDTDSSLLPERLHELDLIWRYKQAKGLDYAEDMTTFERKKEKVIGRDRGPGEVSLSSPFQADDIPEGYWPGTITY